MKISSSHRVVRPAALALIATSLLPSCLSQVVPCSPSAAEGFDYEYEPETGFLIQWSIDSEAETITMQVTQTELAWTSVGFSADGMMIGSDAVIGLPDDGSVSEYEMLAQYESAVVPFSEQEVEDGIVAGSDAGVLMTFTRPLTPTSDGKQTLSGVAGDETWIIWAMGESTDLAYHGTSNHGAVLLDLFCGDESAAADSASSVPTATPTAAPSASAIAPDTTSPTPSPSAALSFADTAAPTAGPTAGSRGGIPTSSPTGAPTPTTVVIDDSTGSPTVSPTPADGDRGIAGSDAPTAAPTPAGSTTSPMAGTPAPSAGGSGAAPVDDDAGGNNQGNGAFRVGSGAAVAMVSGVLAVLGAMMVLP